MAYRARVARPGLPGTDRLTRLRTRARRARAAGLSWLALAAGSATLGYVLVTRGPAILAIVLAVSMMLLALHYPQPFGRIAVACAPLAGALMMETFGWQMRVTQYLWWVAAFAILTLAAFQRRRLFLSPATLALAAYGALLALAPLWADRPQVATREAIQFFTFVMVFLVLENLFRRFEQLDRAIDGFLIGTSILIVGTIIGETLAPVLPFLKIAGGGVALTWVDGYFHQVTIATVAGVVSLICAARLIQGGRSGPAALAHALLLTLALLLQLILVKRIELVGLMFAGFLLALFYGWKRWLFYVSLAGLASFAILITVPSIRERFRETGDYEATKWHYVYPAVAWYIFRQEPVLGGGGGVFEYRANELINSLGFFDFEIQTEKNRAPHNIVAEVAAESGAVGLILFGTFIGIVLWSAWRGSGSIRSPAFSPRENLCRALLGAMCLELIVSLAQNPHQWDVFWLILAFGYRAARLRDEPDGSPGRNGARRRIQARVGDDAEAGRLAVPVAGAANRGRRMVLTGPARTPWRGRAR